MAAHSSSSAALGDDARDTIRKFVFAATLVLPAFKRRRRGLGGGVTKKKRPRGREVTRALSARARASEVGGRFVVGVRRRSPSPAARARARRFLRTR